MTTNRPYRSALSAAEAKAELAANAGTQFDPAVVEALLAALAEAERSRRLDSGGCAGS